LSGLTLILGGLVVLSRDGNPSNNKNVLVLPLVVITLLTFVFLLFLLLVIRILTHLGSRQGFREQAAPPPRAIIRIY